MQNQLTPRSFLNDCSKLTARSKHCLRSASLTYIGEVISMTDRELLKIRNFGVASLRNVRKATKQFKVSNAERARFRKRVSWIYGGKRSLSTPRITRQAPVCGRHLVYGPRSDGKWGPIWVKGETREDYPLNESVVA